MTHPGSDKRPDAANGDNRVDAARAALQSLNETAAQSLKEALAAQFEAEVELWCGPRNENNPGRLAKRNGTIERRLLVDGHEIELRVQRMIWMADGRAVYPPSFDRLFEETKQIDEARKEDRARQAPEYVAGGATMRRVKRLATIGKTDSEAGRGRGKTMSSDAFKPHSRELLDKITKQPLNHLKLAVVVIDGIEISHRTMLWALGITTEGKKVVLGFVEGAAGHGEDTPLVNDLVLNMVSRGADFSYTLFDFDGGTALRAGLREAGFPKAPVQNCIIHKARNVERAKTPSGKRELPGVVFYGLKHSLKGVLDDPRPAVRKRHGNALVKELHALGEGGAAEVLSRWLEQSPGRQPAADRVPESADSVEAVRDAMRGLVSGDLWFGVKARINAIWRDRNPVRGLERLRAYADKLESLGYTAAANSLRTNDEETFTVTRLGVQGRLWRSLASNNMQESPNNTIREILSPHHNPGGRRKDDDDRRSRWFAWALDQVEKGWNQVVEWEGLRDLSLAVLRTRHPDVKLELSSGQKGTVVLRIEADPGPQAQELTDAALADFRRWAEWAEELTSTPEHEASKSRHPLELEDPLAELREELGEKWAAVVNERALELGATAASKSDEWLGERMPEVAAAMERLGLLEHEGAELREPIARLVALARVHERRGLPLSAGRSIGAAIAPLGSAGSELRDENSRWIESRAAELEVPLGKQDDRSLGLLAEELGNPIDVLAKYVALRREEISRAAFRELGSEPAAAAPSVDEPLALDRSLDELAPYLLKGQLETIREYAKAVGDQVRDVDLTVLWEAMEHLDDPYLALDRKGALESAAVTNRVREASDRRGAQVEDSLRLKRRAKATRGPVPGVVRDKLEARAAAHPSRLEALEQEVGEAELAHDQLRAEDRHRDNWWNKHGWNAVHWFGLKEAIETKECALAQERDAPGVGEPSKEPLAAAPAATHRADELVLASVSPDGRDVVF